MKDKNGKKNISSSKGVLFIFEILENLFDYIDKSFKFENSEDKIGIPENMILSRLKEGRKLSKKGQSIIKEKHG